MPPGPNWAAGALAVALAAATPAAGQSAHTLYLLKCSGCHRADGLGAPDAGVPRFPGFVGDLARDGDGRIYMLHVPGVAGSNLPNAELSAVLNYVLDKWAPAPSDGVKRFTPAEVDALRALKINDIVAYRRTLVARLRKSGAAIADYPWP